jgi:hypothetical protein
MFCADNMCETAAGTSNSCFPFLLEKAARILLVQRDALLSLGKLNWVKRGSGYITRVLYISLRLRLIEHLDGARLACLLFYVVFNRAPKRQEYWLGVGSFILLLLLPNHRAYSLPALLLFHGTSQDSEQQA